MTIEGPIEALHPNKPAMIAQTETGTDTWDFALAVRRTVSATETVNRIIYFWVF